MGGGGGSEGWVRLLFYPGVDAPELREGLVGGLAAGQVLQLLLQGLQAGRPAGQTLLNPAVSANQTETGDRVTAGLGLRGEALSWLFVRACTEHLAVHHPPLCLQPEWSGQTHGKPSQ